MLRRTLRKRGGFFQNFKSDKNNFFTSLWNKPQTRDERVKSYVPEVIEESLQEQRAVLQENTARDVVVELGYKILREIENKRPTPSIAPHLDKILQEYECKDLIAQRPLSYLLYPCSSMSGGHQPHELVSNFTENFRELVEEVERSGCSLRVGKRANISKTTRGEATLENVSDHAATLQEASSDDKPSDTSKSGPVIMVAKEEHEPMDVTLFIRVVSAMALANVQNGDLSSAVRCVDVCLDYVVEPSRHGGLLGMKAGILVHQRKFEEAVQCANEAVQVSGNIQGYIHGAFALRMLNRLKEVVQLLEKGREDHPMNTQIVELIEEARKDLEDKPVVEEPKKITS